ncbi:SDR family NAD(P)-dependent oxidoreductase [Thermodesulfobacteriota bacterium]
MRLKDKIALVTGSAGDIGRTTATRFAREGARLILSDINEEGCRRVQQDIQATGASADMILADVTKEDQIVAMFEQVKRDHGRLDILANIAGGDYENDAGLGDINYEKMSFNIDVNLKSCILCCREASNIMIEQQYGKIVNMCSLVWRGSPMQYSYSAAKGGVYAFTRSLALTLGMFNINVNALAPALIEVEVIKKGMEPEMWAALKEDIESRYPMGRVGQPIDVANCALFLASDEASFITGQIIEVSGGARL